MRPRACSTGCLHCALRGPTPQPTASTGGCCTSRWATPWRGCWAFDCCTASSGHAPRGLGLLWRKLTGAPAWLRTLPQAPSVTQINWRQGQNLLMALAIVLLLALVVPLTLSGYATYNDWGAALGGNWMGEAMEEVHEFFGKALLFVVLAHIALIAGLSLLRRKNQALPMLTGRVEGKGPDLVPKNRTWLAALLLIATLAFGAWQWQQSPSGWVASGTSTERQRHHDDD